jgi:hypothetical protein
MTEFMPMAAMVAGLFACWRLGIEQGKQWATEDVDLRKWRDDLRAETHPLLAKAMGRPEAKLLQFRKPINDLLLEP